MSGEPQFDLNQRLALVCVDASERQSAACIALEALGYGLHLGRDPADVLDRLRKNAYEVVVIDEAFQHSRPHDHTVLHAIQWMPMSRRRGMFVALLGGDLKTFDGMTAFTKSVNAVINYSDLPQLRALLERAIAANHQFFRVLRAVLEEAGKS